MIPILAHLPVQSRANLSSARPSWWPILSREFVLSLLNNKLALHFDHRCWGDPSSSWIRSGGTFRRAKGSARGSQLGRVQRWEVRVE